jgi:AraC-like DNA-binding protein
MDDFASATMLRLLLRAMAAHGLAPPLPQPDAARVPLQHKQQAVACIVHAGGLPLLLQLAQQIQHIDGEPLHHALVGARDPHDFLARWQRLERYVHLSHRVRCLAQDALCLTLEHTSTRGAPPLAAESVAVLGAWIGALRTIGCRGLRVAVGDQVVHGEGATSAWAAGSADRWQLRWLGTDPASATVPRGAPGASLPATPPLDSPLPWPQPAADLARWMAHDLAAAHRVADAAAALGLSLRTLQRQLAAAGTSYRSLLGEVRVRRAAVYLARPGTTLAEIGFLCGFADQAHFTREFTRRAGLPPARYRGAATAR